MWDRHEQVANIRPAEANQVVRGTMVTKEQPQPRAAREKKAFFEVVSQIVGSKQVSTKGLFHPTPGFQVCGG